MAIGFYPGRADTAEKSAGFRQSQFSEILKTDQYVTWLIIVIAQIADAIKYLQAPGNLFISNVNRIDKPAHDSQHAGRPDNKAVDVNGGAIAVMTVRFGQVYIYCIQTRRH